jgi:hypothetical protein
VITAKLTSRVIQATAAVIGAVTIGGCSSELPVAPKSPTVAVAVDCSRSVRGEQHEWNREISTVAEAVLSEDRTLRVGCFAGERTGVKWLLPYNGVDVPAMTGGEVARKAAQKAWGRSLESVFDRELQVVSVPGTDWLSALQAASEQRGLHAVYIFSDLVQQAEGINLAERKAPAEIQAIARAWAPRFVGLRGVLVVSVGGGEKLGGQQPDTQGVELFKDLSRLVPFRPEVLSTL